MTNADLWRAIGAEAARKGYAVETVLVSYSKEANALIREGFQAERAKLATAEAA